MEENLGTNKPKKTTQKTKEKKEDNKDIPPT